MRFIEAIKELQEGKRIRQKIWSKEQYIYLDVMNLIKTETGNPYNLDFDSFIQDWEVCPLLTNQEKSELMYIVNNCLNKKAIDFIEKTYDDSGTGITIHFNFGNGFKHCLYIAYLEYDYEALQYNKLYTLEELGL